MSGISKTRIVVVVASGVAGLVALSGCSTVSSLIKSGSDAVIEVLPGAGSTSDVPAHSPITIRAHDGKLVAVKVEGPTGELRGEMSADGTEWVSNRPSLGFGAEYHVVAHAIDGGGTQAQEDFTFSTVKPENTSNAELKYVSDGNTMGVGMPLRLEFDRAVENRAEVERNLEVLSSRPLEGAWGWDEDGQAVTFRPRAYWPAHNTVVLRAGLKGIETSPGVLGDKDLNATLNIGSKVISTVDAESLEMTIRRDGEVISTIPVTTGKYGFETRSGIKPILAKEGTVIMDAASGGTSRNSSDYYRLTVHDSMRLTWSGEYVHAAPWSTGSQGRSNVSHGCIGMSSSNAEWFYGMSDVGDVVVVKNTGREEDDPENGITEWNVPWKKWLKKSETGAVKVPATLPTPPKPKESDTGDSSESS